eukprot:646468-Heterocapsa_arctica.AAC.1
MIAARTRRAGRTATPSARSSAQGGSLPPCPAPSWCSGTASHPAHISPTPQEAAAPADCPS